MLELTGVIPALITPSNSNGNLDLGPIPRLIDFTLARGVSGFFVGGSTGEGYCLTTAERKQLAEKIVAEVSGRVPVIVHVGSLDYREVVELSEHAKKIGADAVSSVIPFYFSYSLQEVRDYYQAISDASELPNIIYFLPHVGNTMTDPEQFVETVLTVDRIYGIKYTDTDLHRLRCLKQLASGQLKYFGGNDSLPLPMLTMGADALIGSNFSAIPEVWIGIYNAFSNGELDRAVKLQDRLTYYIRKLRQIQPIERAKGMLKIRGIDVGIPRKPKAPLSINQEKVLKEVLDEMLGDPLLEMHG